MNALNAPRAPRYRFVRTRHGSFSVNRTRPLKIMGSFVLLRYITRIRCLSPFSGKYQCCEHHRMISWV